ncbi:MAG: SGNH/GDSL hydrolase family protein [Pseudomonadota bacterium]
MGQLVLLGDSMIDNAAYVAEGEPDVPTQLRAELPGHEVVMRAVDGSMARDVSVALNSARVPEEARVLLSVGGNNALDQIGILADPDEKATAEVLVRMGRVREAFRAEYVPVLEALVGRRVLAMTIYNPLFGSGEADLQAPAESALTYFNDVIQQEALARGFSVLDMRRLFNDPADYANPIEPSAQGGAKIVRAVANWVRQ